MAQEAFRGWLPLLCVALGKLWTCTLLRSAYTPTCVCWVLFAHFRAYGVGCMRDSPSARMTYWGTTWPCSWFPPPALRGIPHRQLCQLGPVEEKREGGSGLGQGKGTVGAVGWSGGLEATLWSRVSKERGREKEKAGMLVRGWCLLSWCREMDGVWELDDVGDAGLGKNQEWLCKLQTFWNAFFKKKKRFLGEGTAVSTMLFFKQISLEITSYLVQTEQEKNNWKGS